MSQVHILGSKMWWLKCHRFLSTEILMGTIWHENSEANSLIRGEEWLIDEGWCVVVLETFLFSVERVSRYNFYRSIVPVAKQTEIIYVGCEKYSGGVKTKKTWFVKHMLIICQMKRLVRKVERIDGGCVCVACGKESYRLKQPLGGWAASRGLPSVQTFQQHVVAYLSPLHLNCSGFNAAQ